MKKTILSILIASLSLSLACAESGIASWYTADRNDAITANGEKFDNKALTAAHKTLKFGSIVKVTNETNGKTISVRINDRGPYVDGRIIDLTSEGARQLGFYADGTCPVSLEVVSEPDVPESEYVSGEDTGWYTLQIGTYTNTQNAYELTEKIKSKGMKPTVEVLPGPMLRVSVANIPRYSLEETKKALAEIGVTEPLERGARNPYGK